MPKVQDFLNSYTVKIASYLAWVNIPDISNAVTKDERDAKIDNFKLEVGQKLFRRSASAVVTGIGVYGIFDTKDEEKALESWQDKVELGLGLVAAGLLFIKQDMEFQCDRAKACEFVVPVSKTPQQNTATNLINLEEEVGAQILIASTDISASSINNADPTSIFSINNSK